MTFRSKFNDTFDPLIGGILGDDEATYTPKAYPHPSSKTTTIEGIFKHDYVEINGEQSFLPIFVILDAAIASPAQDDNMTIESVDYKIKIIQKDNTGTKALVLEKQ